MKSRKKYGKDFPIPHQVDPFEKDRTRKVIRDPIEGVPTSEEWKHPEVLEECPVNEPQAARWQENSLYHINTGTWVRFLCLEIARWVCPPNHQGRISRIETAVAFKDEQAQYLWWGAGITPGWYDILEAESGGFAFPALRFFLRLQSWKKPPDALEAAPLVTTTQVELPGIPHPDLPEWGDARYDFARRDNHVSIFVPEGQYLRMFVEIRVSVLAHWGLFWGRLGGITQTYRGNPDATAATRRWP
jgi:hypothetical protein